MTVGVGVVVFNSAAYAGCQFEGSLWGKGGTVCTCSTRVVCTQIGSLLTYSPVAWEAVGAPMRRSKPAVATHPYPLLLLGVGPHSSLSTLLCPREYEIKNKGQEAIK